MSFGLHECRIDGKVAKPELVAVGVEIYVPSGMGGLFRCTVNSIENGVATAVKPPHHDWPEMTFDVQVNQVVFSDTELLQLRELMREITGYGPDRRNPKPAEVAFLHKARVAALVSYYNEWNWTGEGIEALKRLP